MTDEPVTITESEVQALDWYDTPSSSNVKRVAFERTRVDDEGEQRGTLHVEFHGGGHYRYDDALFEEGRQILAAEQHPNLSVGRTLNQTIKGRRACSKLTVVADPAEDAA